MVNRRDDVMLEQTIALQLGDEVAPIKSSSILARSLARPKISIIS